MVGIRDKTTNRIHVRPVPLFLVGHHVKALDTLEIASQAANDYSQARNQLGEAFGTKKARAAIRAMERNQVDVGAMAGVSDVLQDMIGQKTNSLPQKEEADAITDSNRPIPRYNEKALCPADVCSRKVVRLLFSDIPAGLSTRIHHPRSGARHHFA